MTSGYRETYDRWRADPQAFWAEAAREIAWTKPPGRIFDAEGGVYGRWFPDARLNACFNALDRHVEAGRGEAVALYYDSPVTGAKRAISYRELLDETATLGAALADLGVGMGDRALIYMPMIPEAIVAMLACARIGAVHSVVFGGFAPRELATRIDDAEPKVVLTASCGVEPGRIVEYKPLLDQAIALATHKPTTCVVYQRPQSRATMSAPRDRDWTTLVDATKAAGRRAPCADLAATDPLYILYTSGTTGTPKGVVRDIGGYMVALKWSMSAVFAVEPGETFWAGSDIGWVVGHSYIVYGPLVQGCASVLYEGKPIGTPDAGAYWRVIEDYRVAAFFTAPTGLRAVRKEDPEAKLLETYDISSLHTLFLAGERADPDTVAWAEKVLGVPVIDNWWQTETGWPIAANPVGLGMLPVKRGSPSVPMPGYDVHVVDEAAKPVPPGTMGSIVLKLPLPPGCLPTLYRQDERMRESYLREFPGFYKTADARLHRRGRLSHDPRTDRRHHQRRRPPPVDRRNGGGGGLPSGRRRMRRARRQGRDQGRSPLRVSGVEGGRQPASAGDRDGGGEARARQNRPGRRVQDRAGGGPPAEDPLGQDPARHDEEDRRPRPMGYPGDDRGPEGARRDQGGARGAGALAGEFPRA